MCQEGERSRSSVATEQRDDIVGGAETGRAQARQQLGSWLASPFQAVRADWGSWTAGTSSRLRKGKVLVSGWFAGSTGDLHREGR